MFNNALFFFNHSGCYDSTAKIVFTFIYLYAVQDMISIHVISTIGFHRVYYDLTITCFPGLHLSLEAAVIARSEIANYVRSFIISNL